MSSQHLFVRTEIKEEKEQTYNYSVSSFTGCRNITEDTKAYQQVWRIRITWFPLEPWSCTYLFSPQNPVLSQNLLLLKQLAAFAVTWSIPSASPVGPEPPQFFTGLRESRDAPPSAPHCLCCPLPRCVGDTLFRDKGTLRKKSMEH